MRRPHADPTGTDTSPNLTLKPKITPAMLGSIIRSVSFLIFLLIFAVGFTLTLGKDKTAVWILIGLAVFILILAVNLFFTFMTLKRTEYIFFDDRIEYYEGFLTRIKKIVPLYKITDVGMRKGWFIDTIFNTGTIDLNTAGSFGSAILIRYVENPDNVFTYVQDLLRTYRKKHSST